MFRVLTFNVLAPNFANPKYYPADCHDCLNREQRRSNIMRLLSSVKDSYDVIALQEVTDDTIISTTDIRFGEYQYYRSVLTGFAGMFIAHDSTHWSDYFGVDPEFSYIRNGNALFFRHEMFAVQMWNDISLSTGDHALMGMVIHKPTMKQLRIINVHFDNESDSIRRTELHNLFSVIPCNANIIDLIMGDFNTNMTDISDLLDEFSFTDTLSEVGDTRSTYALFIGKDGPIDNIIHRGESIKTLSSEVLDHNLWTTYPILDRRDLLDPLGTKRLNECIRLFGSDHMPVAATFTLDNITSQ